MSSPPCVVTRVFYKMSSDNDDVLSLGTGSETAFSGFSGDEVFVPPKKAQKAKKMKSVVVKPGPSTSSKSDGVKGKTSKPSASAKKDNKKCTTNKGDKPVIDISKLTGADIASLREVLGIEPARQARYDYSDEPELETFFGQSLENLPNIQVEVDSADISEGEDLERVSQNIGQALFEEGELVDENDEWELPRLRVPEKGKDVAGSLAKMINAASTSQCDTETFISKFKVPANCDRAAPPLVNNEIWKVMDKRAQSQDRSIVEVQNLVAASMVPVIKLAETLKPQIKANTEAKCLLSDALTMLGQVQYKLSVKRRYMIRPNLKKKYQSLCNIATPISTKLFGDEITKDIKTCDSTSFLGRDQSYRGIPSFRGRAGSRVSRRGYYGNAYVSPLNARYQPYPSRGFRPGARGRYTRRAATSTATAPNY